MTEFHPNHRFGDKILSDILVTAVKPAQEAYNDYFGNLPRDHHHQIVHRLYGPKYLTDQEVSDEQAYQNHITNNYSHAAAHLDDANQAIAGLHDMLAYNLGKDHPVVSAVRNLYHTRNELTSAYRKTLGMEKEDTNKQFDDIISRNNFNEDN